MNRSRLFLEYILDRRAGVLEDYVVPDRTTHVTLPPQRNREGKDGSTDAAI